MVHVILSHLGRCPERNREDVRIKITIRELSDEERIQLKRKYRRRRDYGPPRYLKEGYQCPHALAGECQAVREDPAACPVYQAYTYPGILE